MYTDIPPRRYGPGDKLPCTDVTMSQSTGAVRTSAILLTCNTRIFLVNGLMVCRPSIARHSSS